MALPLIKSHEDLPKMKKTLDRTFGTCFLSSLVGIPIAVSDFLSRKCVKFFKSKMCKVYANYRWTDRQIVITIAPSSHVPLNNSLLNAKTL